MKRIVILGMGRSGTSFLARFLGECGVYFDEVSEKYEHSQARLINDSILAELFGARPGLPYGKLPAEEIQLSDFWHAKVNGFIEYMSSRAQEVGSAPYWAFKDPRTTILHSLWIQHFDVIIGTFRSPQQVMESYVSKGWIDGWQKHRQALEYWFRFNQSLLKIYENSQGVKPMYVMDYNGDVLAQTARLCSKLGIPLSDRAQALYDKKHNHFSTAPALNNRKMIQMYESLRKICNLL